MIRDGKQLLVGLFLGFFVLCAPVGIGNAETGKSVTLELVLAVDTSMSIDGSEYALLMQGIAAAFRNSEIISLIGATNGIAVTLFQWSSDVDKAARIPWHTLQDPASIFAFANKVQTATRFAQNQFTGIGRAIDYGIDLLTQNRLYGERLKIDVSGDGKNNYGLPLPGPRLRAETSGIVINGLPIITSTGDNDDLGEYFQNEVIAGPGAFVEVAQGYDDFARAFLRKLRRELNQDVVHAPIPRPQWFHQASLHMPH